MSVGERPQAPWHPLPLSELLILIGAIGTIIGFSRAKSGGFSSGGPTLIAGLVAVALGTVEVTLREHRSGYRSHTLILALLPTIVFHSSWSSRWPPSHSVPRWVNVAAAAARRGAGHLPLQTAAPALPRRPPRAHVRRRG